MDRDATGAEDAFGDADRGDVRRTARLVPLATMLGAQPTARLPAASDAPVALKAVYRFFANNYVRADALLARHILSTTRRMQPVPLVLAVHDTIYLDWTDHPAPNGWGPLAAPSHQGLLAHTTRAIPPAHVPLGLLQPQVWARAVDVRRNQDHQQRRIDAKERQKWLTSLEAVIAARAACPTTQFVRGGDHEAAVYDHCPARCCWTMLNGRDCRIHRGANPSASPPTLRQRGRAGQLGGFHGRKRAGDPGVAGLWKGFQHLVDVTATYRSMRPAPVSPARRIQNKYSG